MVNRIIVLPAGITFFLWNNVIYNVSYIVKAVRQGQNVDITMQGGEVVTVSTDFAKEIFFV